MFWSKFQYRPKDKNSHCCLCSSSILSYRHFLRFPQVKCIAMKRLLTVLELHVYCHIQCMGTDVTKFQSCMQVGWCLQIYNVLWSVKIIDIIIININPSQVSQSVTYSCMFMHVHRTIPCPVNEQNFRVWHC